MSMESEISALEETLKKPTIRMIERFKDDAKEAIVPSAELAAEVTFYATIKNSEESSVVRVAKLSLQDLYGQDYGPLAQLGAWTKNACSLLQQLGATDENDVDFELLCVQLWRHLSDCNNFLGVSVRHDELAAIVQQLVCAESASPLTHLKVRALASAFDVLSKRPWLTDSILDEFYQALEAAGSDLNHAMGFASVPHE